MMGRQKGPQNLKLNMTTMICVRVGCPNAKLTVTTKIQFWIWIWLQFGCHYTPSKYENKCIQKLVSNLVSSRQGERIVGARTSVLVGRSSRAVYTAQASCLLTFDTICSMMRLSVFSLLSSLSSLFSLSRPPHRMALCAARFSLSPTIPNCAQSAQISLDSAVLN
jgi:hypothetical protein